MAIDKIVKELRRPFTPEAVQFKIQTVSKEGKNALVVVYIDARQVGERLNQVCPGQWIKEDRELHGANGHIVGVECTIGIAPSVSATGQFLRRSDVGVNDGDGGYGGLKAVYSDAFKRAGVHWGIGVPNYYTPKCYIPKTLLRQDKWLTKEAIAQARGQYEQWLKGEGIERFGEPLDLGDTVESQGDVEVMPGSDPDAERQEEDVAEQLEESVVSAEQIKEALEAYAARNNQELAWAKQQLRFYCNSMGLPLTVNGIIKDPAAAAEVLKHLGREE